MAKSRGAKGSGKSASLQPLSGPELDLVFAALSDPTRRQIIATLSRAEASVTQIARPFEISLPAISKHLDVLEKAHLISKE
ncbi:MAG: ArsR/SmtB family transcription factor, partial [Nitrososphaerales archaeon]